MAYRLEFRVDGDMVEIPSPREGIVSLRPGPPKAHELTSVKTAHQAANWCFEKLQSIPGFKCVVTPNGSDYYPITFAQVVNRLEVGGYVYLLAETEEKGNFHFACAERLPSQWNHWLSYGWFAVMGICVIAGLLPAIMIGLLFGYGDGSGNESGIAGFFVTAAIIGAVLLCLSLVGGIVAFLVL